MKWLIDQFRNPITKEIEWYDAVLPTIVVPTLAIIVIFNSVPSQKQNTPTHVTQEEIEKQAIRNKYDIEINRVLVEKKSQPIDLYCNAIAKYGFESFVNRLADEYTGKDLTKEPVRLEAYMDSKLLLTAVATKCQQYEQEFSTMYKRVRMPDGNLFHSQVHNALLTGKIYLPAKQLSITKEKCISPVYGIYKRSLLLTLCVLCASAVH